MQQDLIYDVGMNNGDDTAHYLSRGFRVIAIEANPFLSDMVSQRFADEIKHDRLRVLNLGIAESNGVLPFWINTKRSELSSFSRTMATRFHDNRDVVMKEIECVPFVDILREHGVPFYLKIDIEGSDHLCLGESLGDDLPTYISVEAHSLTPLFQLQQLGFNAFKCINQLAHHAPETMVNHRSPLRRSLDEFLQTGRESLSEVIPGMSLARSIGHRLGFGRSSPIMNGITRSPMDARTTQDADSDASGRSPVHVPTNAESFPRGSSGPFGEDTFGDWRSFEAVAYDWLHLNQGFPTRSTLKKPGWFDFHAKRQ